MGSRERTGARAGVGRGRAAIRADGAGAAAGSAGAQAQPERSACVRATSGETDNAAPAYTNPQTEAFCTMLQIENKINPRKA